jgi:hypothetical protein
MKLHEDLNNSCESILIEDFCTWASRTKEALRYLKTPSRRRSRGFAFKGMRLGKAPNLYHQAQAQ